MEPPQNSREKILDVAEARFAKRGYAGVGLREVAEAADLSKSALFHHFHSKAELYLAVLDRVMAHIERRVQPALSMPVPVPVRLDACADRLVDALAEQPNSARLLLRALFEDDDLPEDSSPEADAFQRRLDRLLGGVEALVEAGAADGSLRPTSAAHTLQSLIGATVYHFASGEFGEALMGGPLFSAEAVRRRKQEILSLFHHGLHRESD